MTERGPAELEALLLARGDQLQALQAELDETNRGVVALYAELDDKAGQLQEALELKSRFLSYMSHEFRTPLSAVASMSDILLQRMDGSLNEEQGRQVEFIRTAVRELTEMVDDLLDLAKVDAGRVTISADWFETVDLFAALRGMFKPILANTGINLAFEDIPQVPKLYSDDRKLAQILRNFISNALKFTRTGTVRVGGRPLGEHEIEFSVVDTGIGISAEHLPNLFNDFVQIDTRLQRRLRGTGLGLSLSRKLAELLGGRVGAESELGKGSRFWVTIPIRFRQQADP
ncbi:MAG TPA: HAMP domain-containing sensor histidine kinase [Steroidobacteraceae bacterium]|nr:HAMP domain-containing sensor histidine kinase [Steroidobacteraceae bacterium]